MISSADELAYGDQYSAFMDALAAASSSPSDAEPPPTAAEIVTQILGQTAAKLIQTKGFQSDKTAVSDTLILVKLAADGSNIDVATLNTALRAIVIIENVADGVVAPALRPVFVLPGLPLAPAEPPAPAQPAPGAPATAKTAAMSTTSGPTAQDLVTAIQPLTALPSSVLQLTQLGPASKPAGAAKTTTQATQGTGTRQILTIPAAVARTLDPAVARVAANMNLDLGKTTVPDLVSAMTSHLTTFSNSLRLQETGAKAVFPDVSPAQGLGGDPGTGQLTPLPTSPAGIVQPVGIGDLLVVKQRPLRYEGGDVAHIENVLKSESFTRATKRIDLTETTVSTETDVTTEEEQDTQSKDRFALQRETANTVTQDASLKAGASVSASCGPMVSVKANLNAASSTAQQDSTNVSTSYSQDITTRAASSITQTTKQLQTMLTSNSFEEDISHGFDNTNGADNISGVYQWVNKVYEAQVYNYGQRLMFDVMVPEPAAFLFGLMAGQPTTTTPLPPEPVPFTTTPDQITWQPGSPTYYQTLAARYGTVNLDPPPPPLTTVSTQFVSQSGLDDTKVYTDKTTVQIPGGYVADTASLQLQWMRTAKGGIWLIVGSTWLNDLNQSSSMSSETGSVPVTLMFWGGTAYTVVIEVSCKLAANQSAYQTWQEKVYATIMADYQKQLSDYQNAVSNAQQTSTPGQGRNPLTNTELQQNELKKACITQLTGQQYEAFGAVEISSEGYPEELLANIPDQGTYARFLEEAFEWDQMMYFYYPYYWGRKSRWTDHALASDPDPTFSDFLNAGFARVVFPVRLNFELDVISLLETGLPYAGGDLPTIQSPQYVSIITEIQEQDDAPGDEVAQGDPWEVTLPTTLVKLREDDQLPTWGWDNSVPPNWVESAPLV